MCSIIGYMGKESAAPILLESLKAMEYRGCDSAGLATNSHNNISLKKGTGKVGSLDDRIHLADLRGSTGIGHTRWATHGKVTESNAHPHMSNSGEIAIVHNGIVENFEELKASLQASGYAFQSETDSEVIANMLQKNHESLHDIKDAMLRTVSELAGSYSFVAMLKDGRLAAARFHQPLVIGVGRGSYFLSSDVLGFFGHTDDAIYLDDRSIAIIDRDGLEVVDFDGSKITPHATKVSKEFADADKGKYAHYTLKEIYEQPQTIIKAGGDAERIRSASDSIKDSGSVYITGSGTSYNAALVGRQLLFQHAGIKAECIMSSELPFLPELEPGSVLVAISQSGESGDVLEAVKIAKRSRCKIISIVNHATSSLARESDVTIQMNCGPEIGVAATKSFTAQLVTLYRLVQELAGNRLDVDYKETAGAVSETLQAAPQIKRIAADITETSDIYILGRGIHYPIAIESALKLKELAYIHAEGIAGGELKHGPLALIDSSVFAVIINPNDATYRDTMISAREIKARGAKVIGISDVKSDIYDYWIGLPKAKSTLAYVISELVPVQLLSYYTALEKDADPDSPRNLAKSVTVK